MLILGVEKGRTYLEVTETKRRIYDEDHIRQVLDSLPTKYKLCFTHDDKMTFLFNHKVNFSMGRQAFTTNKIVIKNAKRNIRNKNELFAHFFNRVDKYIVFIKIGNMNVVRLTALALSAVTILGAYGQIVKFKSSIDEKTTNEVTTKIDANGKAYDDLVYDMTEQDDNYDNLETDEIDSDTVFSGPIQVGTRLDAYSSSLIANFKKSDNFKIVDYCSKAYDFDCDLFLALLTNETGLDHTNTVSGGSRFNGSGNGICQVENTNIGKTFKTYNHITKQIDSITVTKENIIDYKTNVKIGAIIFKNCLDKYYGNIYLSLQAYNYGDKMMHTILSYYAVETGLTIEQICNNYNDLGWMKYVNDAHDNPQKYNPDWKETTYGTPNYIEKVLGYYTGDNITYESVNTK